MKVAITTIVSLNPGDAAILQGTLVLLREAYGGDLEVTVFDHQGPTAARYYPWTDFRPTLFGKGDWGGIRRWVARRGYAHRVTAFDRWRIGLAALMMSRGLGFLARLLVGGRARRSIRTYQEADLVVASGGTYLVEHYNLLTPLLEYELVLQMGRPLVFFPQSLGPFESTGYRDRLRKVFARSERIFVRDDQSAGHLADLGVPPTLVEVVPDAAFALAAPTRAAGAAEEVEGADRRVAISVRDWRRFGDEDPEVGRSRYLRSIAAAATAIVGQGLEVTFLSTCQGIPEYWTDDASVADEVVTLLSAEVAASTTVDRAFRQPAEVMEAFGGFRAVIATRMHAAILAMSAGVPVLGIAYEFKTSELFRELGLESWTVDIGTMEPTAFADLASRFVEGAPGLRPTVEQGVGRLGERLGIIVRDLAAS